MRTRNPARFAVLVFVGVAGVFIAIGANEVLKQQRALADARPVNAVVISSEVATRTETGSKGRRSTKYRPLVRYGYAVDGVLYRSDRVFPLGSDASRARAERIVADHPPGKTVTVWHDPADPSRAYLLRETDPAPYFFVLGPMIHLAVGLGLWAAIPLMTGKVAAPVSAKAGWFEVPLRAPIRARAKPWRVVAVAWYLIGSLAIAHYFHFAPRPYHPAMLIGAPVYLALGLIPLAMMVYYRRMRRNHDDARLFVDTDRFVLGRTFKARTEQTFHKHLPIESIRLGLVCEATVTRAASNKKSVSTSNHYETWSDPSTPDQATPGRTIETKANLKAPADQPASTPTDFRAYPRHAWRIVLEVKIPGAPDYKAQFPVTVAEN